MPIQFIVHGDTEYYCIPIILKAFGKTAYRPINLKGKGFGDSRGDLVKGKIAERIRDAVLKSPEKIVIVTDLEERRFCPGEFAALIHKELREKLKKTYGGSFVESLPPLSVVVAHSRYENWIIADPDGITQSNLIGKNPKNTVRQQADSKPAVTVLNECFAGYRRYSKTDHAIAQKLTSCVKFNDGNVQRRSKSLRKFLRETGCIPS
ncbi:MAG: hypothetical protein AB1742_08210 [bacterium]